MRRLTLPLLLGLLAACAPDRGPTGFRDAARPIYSNAVLDPQRLAGRWVQVAAFAAAASPPCAPGTLTVTPDGPGLGLAADLCLDGRRGTFSGRAVTTAPGRFRPVGADPAGIGAEWWVLWVDEGYRTLVIGTPSGGFGIILNRDPALPPDRAKAAREILDWNGYDLAHLRSVPPP